MPRTRTTTTTHPHNRSKKIHVPDQNPVVKEAVMRLQLVAEVAVMCLAVILLGTYEGWLKWPEGALMTAALTVASSIQILHKAVKKPKM